MGDDFISLLKDVPAALLEDAAATLARFFTVAFLHVQESPNQPDTTRLLGSGTLVSVGQTHAILTAHHVLQVLPKTGRLCILLEKTRTPHTIDLAGVMVLEIARGSDDSVGPDLGAVVLSSTIAGTIGAKRMFYNMDAGRDEVLNDPPPLDFGPWTLQGYLDERTVARRQYRSAGRQK